ncbi:hypothetical protein [Limosilactobacillus fermentum]|nr:hypothetical protein [Limosilactobacillus fermentum]MDU3491739.1 hypothetical protein [Limosilactobacillus fermentum]MDU4240047.1 hypothetical protein [Limosilactobacillus fermentum]
MVKAELPERLKMVFVQCRGEPVVSPDRVNARYHRYGLLEPVEGPRGG